MCHSSALHLYVGNCIFKGGIAIKIEIIADEIVHTTSIY